MDWSKPSGWSVSELAVLYGAHAEVHVEVEVGEGVTEEGDPWFVLELPDGTALVHFARIDGGYVSVTSMAGSVDSDRHLLPLVIRFLRRNKKPAEAGS